MPTRLTREHALARFHETHGDQYDYSRVEYVDTRTKVVIICPKHGPFKQGPSEHWKGQGCPPCARPRQTGAPARPFDKVEPRLIAAHNGKYTYDGSTYRDSSSKIRATCPLHGDFWTQVASHLQGKYGCRECGNIARGQALKMNYEEWLRLARERYGDRCRRADFPWQIPQRPQHCRATWRGARRRRRVRAIAGQAKWGALKIPASSLRSKQSSGRPYTAQRR